MFCIVYRYIGWSEKFIVRVGNCDLIWNLYLEMCFLVFCFGMFGLIFGGGFERLMSMFNVNFMFVE